jgi:hypothetical protein
LADKKVYVIEGEAEIGGSKVWIEDHATEKERHITAFTAKQATWGFAKRFEKKFNTSIYIGDANVYEDED